MNKILELPFKICEDTKLPSNDVQDDVNMLGLEFYAIDENTCEVRRKLSTADDCQLISELFK